MLDMKFIRDHAEEVKRNVERRRADVDVDALLRADEERVATIQRLEEVRRERNEIAEQMKTAEKADRPALIERGKTLKEELGALETSANEAEGTWRSLMMRVPNMTHPDAPTGEDDSENKEVKVIGKVETLSFAPQSHVELGKALDVLDFERGAKVAGAKFYFIKGKLALLEQALIQWVLKEAVAEGFVPMLTPDLAKDDVLIGTGYNPRGPETQIYSIENTDLSLVGTAEIPLGGYHKDEILDRAKLPIKYVGLSHCFRTEAGAYGRESNGLYRVHQFDKVELFAFTTQEQSDAVHEELRAFEERIFTKLGVPFRVVDICTGDLGGPAYRKYDLEAWMWGKGEGKGGWGEVTSASNCTDYQARRLNIRTRKDDGNTEFVHTLNGTAVATSRGLIAIMENYQQEDGSILVPEVLRPFCGFDRIEKP
ncbi:MAG: serine--tRNA ligase [Patescibacteria group bacterium]